MSYNEEKPRYKPEKAGNIPKRTGKSPKKKRATKGKAKSTFSREVFKKRLIECMDLERYNRTSLAAASGLSRTALYKWMEYGDKPSEKSIGKLADILHTRTEYLLGEDDFRTEDEEYKAKYESDHAFDKLINAIIDKWIKLNGYRLRYIVYKEKGNDEPDRIFHSPARVPQENEIEVCKLYLNDNEDDYKQIWLSDQDRDLLHEELIEFLKLRLHAITRRYFLTLDGHLQHTEMFKEGE